MKPVNVFDLESIGSKINDVITSYELGDIKKDEAVMQMGGCNLALKWWGLVLKGTEMRSKGIKILPIKLKNSVKRISSKVSVHK